MQSPELAFCTTQELIEELMRRNTFQGVVVHADDELKHEDTDGTKIFKVHLNANLSTTQASRILETVAAYIDQDD